MLPTPLLTLVALAASSLAAPTAPSFSHLKPANILALSPETSSCASPPAPGECRTAAQSAPFLNLSFFNFNTTTFGEQAALLSLILFETAGLKYDRNHFPGRPGQGTRNMQMPEYNLKYAHWVADHCANCGVSSKDVDEAEKEGVDAVLELVNTDFLGFASAAWFLGTQCEGSVREGLKAGTEEGWEAYLTECVGTEVTEERTAIWKKAIAKGEW